MNDTLGMMTLQNQQSTDVNPIPRPQTNDDIPLSRTTSHSSEESETANFHAVINAINFDALARVALQARWACGTQCSQSKSQQELSIEIQQPPWTGSNNLVYVLEFSDGIRWVARIPGNGIDSFESLEVSHFKNRIHVSRFLRLATSIPIPEIFTWSTACKNPAGVPYTLESFAEGRQLSEAWIDNEWSSEEKRIGTVRNLARVMSELHRFSFDQIGSLSSDLDVGPDVYMAFDQDKLLEGEDLFGHAQKRGPFNSAMDDLLEGFEEPEAVDGQLNQLHGEHALLSLALHSLPSLLHLNGPFALGHPDFNYQNLFVDEEGNITAIIDWDGTCITTRALAFARYPSWITRDWDPVMYQYGDEYDDHADEGPREEDSPAQLLRYRQEYANALAEMGMPPSKYKPEDTLLSPIIEAINIAQGQSINRPWILMWLLYWAFDGIPPISLNKFCEKYERGEVHDWIDLVREAFSSMWHGEERDVHEYEKRYLRFRQWMMSCPDRVVVTSRP